MDQGFTWGMDNSHPAKGDCCRGHKFRIVRVAHWAANNQFSVLIENGLLSGIRVDLAAFDAQVA
jgi:hypothetical protein